MFSKQKTILHVVLSVLLIFSVSCGQLFGEKPPLTIPPNTKLGVEQCFENVLPVLKGFMAGTANEADVRGMWRCLGAGINEFQKKVKGSGQNYYNARELVKFFEDHFFVGTKINDPLLEEIMHVKQLFIGGSVDIVTKDELNLLIKFSSEMESICVDLLPYMRVYAMNWTAEDISMLDENVLYFENANRAIQKAAKDLAALIARNEKSYSMQNFSRLMTEVQVLYDEEWEWLKVFNQAIPLIEKLKSSLAGGDPSVIAANEWRRFALLGGRGYIQFLRYYYFITKADEVGATQLTYLANSVEDLFSYLGDMVKEKPSGIFTKTELLEVIQAMRAVFPKISISDGLVNETMKIKTVLFGGSTEQWTPDDFIKAQSKVQAVRSLTERFMNFIDVYTFRWKPEDLPDHQAQQFFQTAEDNIIESSSILGSVIESEYDIHDFVLFCNEYDKLIPPQSDESSWTDEARKIIPTIITGKQIILSDDNSVIQKNKWNEFFFYVTKIYGRAMYVNYFLKSDLFYSVGLNSLDKFSRKTTDILSDLIKRRKDPLLTSISYTELDRLVEALSVSQLWLQGVKPDTVKAILRVAFNRVFLDPVRRLNNEKPTGLSLHTVEQIQKEYNFWSANQHLIEVMYQTTTQELSTPVILDSLLKAEQTDGTRELYAIFNSPLSMSLNSKNMLEIKKTPSQYKMYSASMMNIARVLSRAIFRSYAMEKKRIDDLSGVLIEEVDVLFNDIRPLIVELGLIEPDNTSFARNRFFESNLFTPTADGNNLMSFKEGSHLIIMILSGLELNKLIDPIVRQECQLSNRGEARRFHDQALMTCAAHIYYLNRQLFFSSMPDMRDFLMTMTEADFTAIFYELLKAGGWQPTPDGAAFLGELGLVPHVFQYEEMILQRYDTDKSGTLNDTEASVAYPIYGPLLNSVSPTKIKIINETAFYYLVKNGTVPKTFKEIVALLKDVIRLKVFHKPLGINTNRAKLAKVFGAIADAIHSTSEKKPIEPPKKKQLIEQGTTADENGLHVDNEFDYQWEYSP